LLPPQFVVSTQRNHSTIGVGYAGAGSVSDDSFFVTGGSAGVVRAWRCVDDGARDDSSSSSSAAAAAAVVVANEPDSAVSAAGGGNNVVGSRKSGVAGAVAAAAVCFRLLHDGVASENIDIWF
jgi:hypothetical protein